MTDQPSKAPKWWTMPRTQIQQDRFRRYFNEPLGENLGPHSQPLLPGGPTYKPPTAQPPPGPPYGEQALRGIEARLDSSARRLSRLEALWSRLAERLEKL